MRSTLLKRGLLVVIGIGLIPFSAGGTFSSFNAQVGNATNALSSGTLTLSDQVNSGTTCFSANAAAKTNHNTLCAAALTLANVAPGTWVPSAQSAAVTVEDTGSLNASIFTLKAPTTTDCHDALTTAAPPTITLTGVKLVAASSVLTDTTGFSGVTPGMSISGTGIPAATGNPTVVVSVYAKKLVMSQNATTNVAGGEAVKFFSSLSVASVTVTATSTAATTTGSFAGVATGMVVSATAGIPTYTVVSKVTGTTVTLSQKATATATETVTFGSTYGSQINFAGTPATKPICSTAILTIQESAKVGTATDYYCWFGSGSTGATTGASQATTSGLCTMPLATTLTANVVCTTGVATLHLAALTGPVFKTDVITVTSGSKTCKFKVTTGPYPPTSSTATIKTTFTSSSSKGTTFPGSATPATSSSVSDFTTANAVNSTTTYTVKNFDSLHGTSTSGAPLHLYPISGAGTVSTTAPIRLASLSKRTFTISLYLPEPTAHTQNNLQGLGTFFSLRWYIQQ